jgi:hypothetical protein
MSWKHSCEDVNGSLDNCGHADALQRKRGNKMPSPLEGGAQELKMTMINLGPLLTFNGLSFSIVL